MKCAWVNNTNKTIILDSLPTEQNPKGLTITCFNEKLLAGGYPEGYVEPDYNSSNYREINPINNDFPVGKTETNYTYWWIGGIILILLVVGWFLGKWYRNNRI